MSERRFGEGPPLALGVEEELWILDADTLLPAPAVRTLIAEAEGLALPGTLKTELFASVVELNTPPCESAADAFAALRALRREAAAVAERHGLRLAAAGSHPIADPEEQEIADEPRYREFVEYAGVSARRQGVSGLHVHVAVPDESACLRVLEGMLPWLPLFLALSANSPYLAGRATGLASNRAEILAQLPRHGAPPVFRTFADWQRTVGTMTGLGLVADYTALWWDIRPHPRFGTLEVRAFDQPTNVALSGAFVALVQALAATLLDGDPRAGAFDRTVYEEARWAAAHHGPRASLPNPDASALQSVPELAGRLFELVGPAASRLGSADLLGAIDTTACEGDRQLEVGGSGAMDAVVADLVARTGVGG